MKSRNPSQTPRAYSKGRITKQSPCPSYDNRLIKYVEATSMDGSVWKFAVEYPSGKPLPA